LGSLRKFRSVHLAALGLPGTWLTVPAAEDGILLAWEGPAVASVIRPCRNMRHVIGREPTLEEINGRLGISPETIRKLLGAPPTLTRH
jgi:hypothetical protein